MTTTKKRGTDLIPGDVFAWRTFDVDGLEAERATFRMAAAENRTREAAKATAFEAWWREHDDERTKMYAGLHAEATERLADRKVTRE